MPINLSRNIKAENGRNTHYRLSNTNSSVKRLSHSLAPHESTAITPNITESYANKKIYERIVNHVRSKYQDELSNKRYPVNRFREDISKFINEDFNISISWANYNQLLSCVESKFGNLLSAMPNKKRDSVSASFSKAIYNSFDNQLPELKLETEHNGPLSTKHKLVDICELKKEKDYWAKLVKKNYESHLIQELELKKLKHEKNRLFKESLDKQLKEKQVRKIEESKNIISQDNMIIKKAVEEKEEDMTKRLEKVKVQNDQRKILEDYIQIKNRKTEECQSKILEEESKIALYQQQRKEMEDAKKREVDEKTKLHWKELKETNTTSILLKKESKIAETRKDIEALNQYNMMVENQERYRKEQREQFLKKIDKKTSEAGRILEEAKKKERDIESLRIEREQRELELKARELDLKRRNSTLQKQAMLKEELTQQISEKQMRKQAEKEKAMEFHQNFVLKSVQNYNEEKTKILHQFLQKRENFKKELQNQAEEQSRNKIQKSIEYSMTDFEKRINKIDF